MAMGPLSHVIPWDPLMPLPNRQKRSCSLRKRPPKSIQNGRTRSLLYKRDLKKRHLELRPRAATREADLYTRSCSLLQTYQKGRICLRKTPPKRYICQRKRPRKRLAGICLQKDLRVDMHIPCATLNQLHSTQKIHNASLQQKRPGSLYITLKKDVFVSDKNPARYLFA